MAFSARFLCLAYLFSEFSSSSQFLDPLSMSRSVQPIERLNTGTVLEEPGFSQDAHAKLINVRPA